MNSRSAVGDGWFLPVDSLGVSPEPLEGVEPAGRLLEDVDDDVAEVDEHPLPLGLSLDTEGLHAEVLAQTLLDVLAQSLNVGTGPARGDHEHVGEKEGALDVEQDDVGSVLGEDGVSRRLGLFDTLL